MAPQFFTQRLRFIALAVMLASYANSGSTAQSVEMNPEQKSYAVIGAFSVENNAQRLIELVDNYDLQATKKNNIHRGLFYVYVDESYDREYIRSKVQELRSEYSQFYDAWT